MKDPVEFGGRRGKKHSYDWAGKKGEKGSTYSEGRRRRLSKGRGKGWLHPPLKRNLAMTRGDSPRRREEK